MYYHFLIGFVLFFNLAENNNNNNRTPNVWIVVYDNVIDHRSQSTMKTSTLLSLQTHPLFLSGGLSGLAVQTKLTAGNWGEEEKNGMHEAERCSALS